MTRQYITRPQDLAGHAHDDIYPPGDPATAADGQVWTYDSVAGGWLPKAVSALPEGGTAGQILSRTATDAEWSDLYKSRYDVREFGPTATAAETRATFQAGLDANQPLLVPKGTFTVDAPLILHHGSSIEGASPFISTRSKIETATNSFDLFTPDEDAQWVSLENLWLHNPAGMPGIPNHALRFVDARAGFNYRFRGLRITRFHTAFRWGKGLWNSSFRDITIANVARGFTVTGEETAVAGGDAVIQTLFDTVYVSEFTDWAYELRGVDNYMFLNCNNGGNTDLDANGVPNKNPFYMRFTGKCTGVNLINCNFEKAHFVSADGFKGAALIFSGDTTASMRDCRTIYNTGETDSYQIHVLGQAQVSIENHFDGARAGTTLSDPTRSLLVEGADARATLQRNTFHTPPDYRGGASFASNVVNLDAPHPRVISGDSYTIYNISLTAGSMSTLPNPAITIPALGTPPDDMLYRAYISWSCRISSGPAAVVWQHAGIGSPAGTPTGGGYRSGGDELFNMESSLTIPSPETSSSVAFGLTVDVTGTYQIQGVPKPSVRIEAVSA